MENTTDAVTYDAVEKVIGKWRPYLSESDFDIVKEFTYKTANHIKCDKLLLFYGDGGTGKSTLVNDIISVIGKDCWKNWSMDNDHDTKLIVCNVDEDIINYNCDYNDVISSVKSILSRDAVYRRSKKSTSFIPTANIIMVVIGNDISNVSELLERTNLIHFTHKF